MGIPQGVRRKRLVLLTWILVASFYFYLSYDYVRVTMHDKEFAEYLQYVVQIGGTEQIPVKNMRALILFKADELSLPVQGDQITILGVGDALNVRLNYHVDIDIPLFQRTIYTKQFDHLTKYKKPN